jgi:hypothetical protein
MISVSNDLKTKLMENSVYKEIIIKVPNGTEVEGINFMGGLLSNSCHIFSGNFKSRIYLPVCYDFDTEKWNDDFRDESAECVFDYVSYANYICVSFMFKVTNIPANVDTEKTKIYFFTRSKKNDNPGELFLDYSQEYYLSDFCGDEYKKVMIFFDTTNSGGLVKLANLCLEIVGEKKDIDFEYELGMIQVNLCDVYGDMPPAHSVKPQNIADVVKIGSKRQIITGDNIDTESFGMTESLCSAENIKFGLCESSFFSLTVFDADDVDLKNKDIEIVLYTKIGSDKYGKIKYESIPLGKFRVQSVKKQTKGIYTQRTITAYDGLLKLEDNAADWYTNYMFGLDTTTQTSKVSGFEYARQIYSSYFNYASKVGIEDRSYYTETPIAYYDYWNDIKPNHVSNKYVKWESNAQVNRMRYCKFDVSEVDVRKRYMVTFTNADGCTDAEERNILPSEYEKIDSLKRGVGTDGSVLIDETLEDGKINRFLVNKNDYFMLSPTCISFTVHVPMWTAYNDGSGLTRLLDNLTIYRIEEEINLSNGSVRLMYYNWITKDIFPCESSITGRDVMRSLLEVCGCFFKLDRNGKPKFTYCTKSGLYPSNNLYPADDLYPRGSDGIVPTGIYYDFECEDYTVKDYGKIQILKNSNSNESKTVAEWQYIGDETKENTYIIDDNIFYCAADMQYEYDSMSEVTEMLKNMFQRISNMSFTPQNANCVGLPYLECGDRIILLTENSGIESFIFERNLSGIQSLVDNFVAKGDEIIYAINDFGYKEWNGGT